MRILIALCLAVAIVGCTTDPDTRDAIHDGYVPWWVQDGVPNGDGVIVK